MGYFKTLHGHASCQPCSECPNHFKVKSTCDLDRDTICSDNECEDGCEFDTGLVTCLKKKKEGKEKLENDVGEKNDWCGTMHGC